MESSVGGFHIWPFVLAAQGPISVRSQGVYERTQLKAGVGKMVRIRGGNEDTIQASSRADQAGMCSVGQGGHTPIQMAFWKENIPGLK